MVQNSRSAIVKVHATIQEGACKADERRRKVQMLAVVLPQLGKLRERPGHWGASGVPR